MRWTALVFAGLLLASCASGPSRPEGQIAILSTAHGQALAGAECTVQTDAGSWNVLTPVTINVGQPSGDLWVVCNREGFRTSEVIIRAPGRMDSPRGTRVGIGVGGGFGGTSGVGLSLGLGIPLGSSRARYPSQVVVDMTPLNPVQ